MKRLTKAAIAVALIAALALGAALAWLAATPGGTRWLLETVIRTSGSRVSWQKIEGTISDHLSLKGVKLRLPQQEVELDSVELNWQPLLLLSGTVAIRELVIDGVRIQDDTPPDNKPPVLTWPTAPDTAQLLDVAIARLRLSGFSYRRLQEPPIMVASLTSALTWQDDHLSLNNLSLTTAAGQLRGAAAFGLKRPELTADLSINLAEPIATLDHVTLRARPTVSGGPTAVSASLTLVGFAGRVKRLELGGDVAMEKTALQLRRLRLTKTGQTGIITADGALTFTALETLLTLQIKVAGLDLAQQVNVPTDLSGTLSLAGTMDSYCGSFALANKAGDWQAATVSGAYRGTADGLELAPLTLKALDGTVAGKVALDWRDGFKVNATLDGRDLNPARLAPDWHGVANFQATGNVAWAEQAPVSGSISASLLASRLNGQALTGELQADFVGADLTIDHMRLQGKGFDLRAAGEVQRKLTVAAQINDLSRLVPGAAGAVRGNGWLRWQDDQLSVTVAGSGTGLAWGGTTIAGADLTARLEQGQDKPLHFTATLHDVAYDQYRINTVTVVADGGSWQQPQLTGTAHLTGSELYLPSAGIYLKDIRLAAHLEKNLLRIDSLRAASGPGHIEATALITLADWQLARYQGTLRGDNFQTVYFPELRLQCSPELTFSGTPQKLTLRGSVKIPELHIDGLPNQAIAPSSDAIVEGRTMMTAPAQTLALDMQLQVLLGERVFVKVAGIDAQLGGAVDLSLTSLDRITSRGEIKVVKGNYRTYGVNLDINRGRLFFAGGPIDQPGLDVLALRTVGAIRAGVLVSGTLVNPVTRLYSEPPLPDVDILSYIVLGHPLGRSGEQVGLLTQAAEALLTSGQAEDVQKQIKNRLGLSTLEIQGGVGGTSGAMGYKPLAVTAPGTIPADQQAGITETVLTVGKYITPKLYISYGRSLFTGSSLFLLRYDIFRQWQIETQTGSESGVDLFYKLEFK